jgi:hypothetical protein
VGGFAISKKKQKKLRFFLEIAKPPTHCVVLQEGLETVTHFVALDDRVLTSEVTTNVGGQLD